MVVAAAVAGVGFALLGAGAERLASVWPATEAGRRAVGPRTLALAAVAGLSAAALVVRSALPWWATAAYLAALAALVVLAATDLEQRRLPHLVLDPLVVASVVFVPFNPATTPLSAAAGASSTILVLALLRVVVRGGVARGDLLLMIPIGLLVGFPAAFTALFIAAVAAAATSIVLLAVRRVQMGTYIPFGPFLVLGWIATLLVDDRVIGLAR